MARGRVLTVHLSELLGHLLGFPLLEFLDHCWSQFFLLLLLMIRTIFLRSSCRWLASILLLRLLAGVLAKGAVL